MDPIRNKRLLANACRANGIAFDDSTSSASLQRRLMCGQAPKKPKLEVNRVAAPDKHAVLVQQTFVRDEAIRIAAAVGGMTSVNSAAIAAESEKRWIAYKNKELTGSEFFIGKDDSNPDVISQLMTENWKLVLEDSLGKYYRKDETKAKDSDTGALLEAQDAAYAIAQVEDFKKEEEAAAAAVTSTVTANASTTTDDSGETAPCNLAEQNEIARRRLTEWMIANGKAEGLCLIMGIDPRTDMGTAMTSRPRIIASKLAYAVFPPDNDLKGSLTIDEKNKARNIFDTWDPSEIAMYSKHASDAPVVPVSKTQGEEQPPNQSMADWEAAENKAQTAEIAEDLVPQTNVPRMRQAADVAEASELPLTVPSSATLDISTLVD